MKATMRQMLEAEPGLSDASLARKLTERAKIAISRRTVAKYRMALGIRRQGTLKEAIAEAMAQNPKATDAQLAAKLTASTGREVSARVVIWHRLKLGLRKNRQRRKPGQKRRPMSPDPRKKISESVKERHAKNPLGAETRRKMSESAKRHHAITPTSEETRRRISEALKASWAKRKTGGNKAWA